MRLSPVCMVYRADRTVLSFSSRPTSPTTSSFPTNLKTKSSRLSKTAAFNSKSPLKLSPTVTTAASSIAALVRHLRAPRAAWALPHPHHHLRHWTNYKPAPSPPSTRTTSSPPSTAPCVSSNVPPIAATQATPAPSLSSAKPSPQPYSWITRASSP